MMTRLTFAEASMKVPRLQGVIVVMLEDNLHCNYLGGMQPPNLMFPQRPRTAATVGSC
jgi:hypothetical protein